MKLPPVVWSLVQQFGRQGVNLAVFVLLATLLSPREIGVLGAASVWMGFALVFTELGFGAAIIQRSELRPAHLSSTFVLNTLSGLVFCLLGLALADPFARLIGLPDAAPVLRVLSAVFVTDALAITQIALAQRELRFRDLAIRDVAASLVGGVAGVGAALLGLGVWSLVILALVTSLVELVLIWALSPWRPRLSECSRAAISELWGYSSRIFAFGCVKQVVQNIDKVLIGATLGPVALGLYTFAYRLVVLPVSSFVGAVGAYLFPKFAHMQRDTDGLRGGYLLVIRTLMSLLAPALAALILVAPVVVPAIFGQQWAGAVPTLQLLAVVALLQAVISPAGQLMKALDRPGWLVGWSVGFSAITALSLGVGSRWGITGVGLGLILAHIAGLPIIQAIVRRLIGLSAVEMLAAVAPACLASLALSALIWAAMAASINPATIGVALGLAVGALAYVALLAALDRPLLVALLRGFRNV